MWETEWDWLATVTSTPRDLDVLLEAIATAGTALPVDAKAGLEELGEMIVARRGVAQRALETALSGDRYGTLKRGWRVGVTELAGQSDDTSAKTVARETVARATKQLARHAKEITSESASEAIHDVRKRTKRLRYALDLFGPILPAASVKRSLRRDKRLQDDLGTFQDNDVHRHLVADLLRGSHSLSDDAWSAGALLIEAFDERNVSARRELPAQLHGFVAKLSE